MWCPSMRIRGGCRRGKKGHGPATTADQAVGSTAAQRDRAAPTAARSSAGRPGTADHPRVRRGGPWPDEPPPRPAGPRAPPPAPPPSCPPRNTTPHPRPPPVHQPLVFWGDPHPPQIPLATASREDPPL